MKLEKAIEHLSNPPPTFGIIQKTEYQSAIIIGMEAINCIISSRKKNTRLVVVKLPGETED